MYRIERTLDKICNAIYCYHFIVVCCGKLWFTVVGPDGAHQALESLYWQKTKGYGLANEIQCREMQVV